MLELTIMIAMLLLAAGVCAYLNRRLKNKELEWRQKWGREHDSFAARQNHIAARRTHANTSTATRTTSSRHGDEITDPMHPLNPVNPMSPLNPISPLHASSSHDDHSTRYHSCDSSSSWSGSDSSSSSSSDCGSSSSSDCGSSSSSSCD